MASSSLLNQVLGNRTTAVYGDANVTAATVVPNLNNISDGVNVNVISDSGQLKVFQPLTLNDTFLDTRTEEVYQTSISANVVAIQGALMGWTNKRDMVVGIPITLDFTNTVGVNYLGNDCTSPLSKWCQPEFAMLQPLVRVEIKMGFNNQIIQRSMMNYAEGLRLITLNQSYNWDQMLNLAEIGLPCSVGYTNFMSNFGVGFVTSTTATFNIADASPPVPVMQEYTERWNAYKYALAQLNPSTAFTNVLTTEIGVPLGCLNSFFAEDAFLPAGLPYRIEIEFNPAVHTIAYNNNAITASGTVATVPGFYNALTLQYGNNFVLKYRSHILKASIQDQINNEWITKPLLYQYDTYEFVEIIGDGSTVTLLKDIAINQQRPTTIIMRIMPNATSTNQTAAILGSVVSAPSAGSVTYWNNATTPGFKFKNCFITIGGRQNYYLRMDTIGNAEVPMGSSGMTNNFVNGRCYTDNGHHMPIASKSQSAMVGSLFYININPGDFVQKGYISTDSGALVIRIQTDVVGTYTGAGGVTALPNTHKLVIYKKYPEQIQINAAKNINTIQWPAIAATNSYIIPSTYSINLILFINLIYFLNHLLIYFYLNRYELRWKSQHKKKKLKNFHQ
jgi:hypothetical protein